MTGTEKPRIAPPPSVDDVLSSLTDESRIGQVDFSVVLAPEPGAASAAADAAANRPSTARERHEAKLRAAHVTGAPESPVEPEGEPTVATGAEPAEEPAAEEPATEDREKRAPKRPKAKRPKRAPEPVVEAPAAEAPAVAGPAEPAPAEPAESAEPAEPASTAEHEPTPEPAPESTPEAAPEPTPEHVDVARRVEEVAAEVIARMHAAEHATLRHLEAMELEATRRYELITAQAELDAELIRLQSRREAHAIVSAARLRAGEIDDIHDDPDDEGYRLSVLSDAVSRVGDTTESALHVRRAWDHDHQVES